MLQLQTQNGQTHDAMVSNVKTPCQVYVMEVPAVSGQGKECFVSGKVAVSQINMP